MSESTDNRDDPEKRGDEEDPSPWLIAGVFGAIGMEFVGFTIGGFVIGSWIDERFGTGPLGVLVCLVLSLLAVGWHIHRIARRFLGDTATGDGGDADAPTPDESAQEDRQ